jgi:hypothetical protein
VSKQDHLNKQLFNNNNTVTSGRPGSNSRNQLTRICAISPACSPLKKRKKTKNRKKKGKKERTNSQQATQT